MKERKRAKEALRESEKRYRLLFQHIPVGIFHYDPHLRLTECNERFVAILQSSRDRLIGLDLTPTLVRRAVARSFQVINGDVAALGAKDGSFDVVYGNNILHHLPDQDRGFAEVRRVLRVGGLFCFVEPAATGIRRWVDRVTMSTLARVVPVLEHRRIILEEELADYRRWLSTQDQLPGRLARHGFRCVETRKGMFRLYAKWQAA
jgi:PAS domain-containing protein